VEAVRFLLETDGVRINPKDNLGRTPLEMAMIRGNSTIANLFTTFVAMRGAVPLTLE